MRFGIAIVESSTCRFFYRKRQVSQLFLLFPNCKSKNEFDFFDVIYLYDEEYLRGLDTQYNVLHWLVEPADLTELFWSFFRSGHRGISGSSICLNLLLIAVRLPIFLNVSIAVSHVPSAAPLLGLPHCQSNNEFHASKNEFDFFDVIYLYDQKGLDTQYNVLHWLVEPADMSISRVFTSPITDCIISAELFWTFFLSGHRGISGSSICMNLLIAVRCPNVPLLTTESKHRAPNCCTVVITLLFYVCNPSELDDHPAFWYRPGKQSEGKQSKADSYRIEIVDEVSMKHSLTISLDVSIAVCHVPSSAPLSGLPHRQTELFWTFFLSGHRGISGSSICLNLLIAVRCQIASRMSSVVLDCPGNLKV
ncbi:hypothetical protein T01_6072 [Trichinella spiralis]|uniref:Uncharacterized protein n=1 Tax=Trichinella spiralis TaxID=6334 RepID=A0A0V1BVY1_TRISP|nr:hypothetical protein T01_6072 [Trichinella spiralis]